MSKFHSCGNPLTIVGGWKLSPAFDLTYAYNPSGKWTGQHQMSINGKTDHFTVNDFEACANTASMKRGKAKDILEQVQTAAREWVRIAQEVGVPKATFEQIGRAHRFFNSKAY